MKLWLKGRLINYKVDLGEFIAKGWLVDLITIYL